jgi:regulator of protease activity HflC (stomatin/prohibitin superfamily)
MKTRLFVIGGAVLVAVIILAVFTGSAFTVIDPTERGVKVTFGKMEDKLLSPGLYLINPMGDSVDKVSVTPIMVETNISIGNDAAITSDNQSIGIFSVAYFQYKEDGIITMLKNIGEAKIADIVRRSIIEAIKSEIGRFTIFDIPANQDKISKSIFTSLRDKVTGYPITITEFKIQNFDWSDDFDSQIKETVNRAQQVKQKEQEALVAKAEAEKDIVQAEARAKAVKAEAEGELEAAKLRAEAKKKEGEGIRAYNDQIRQTLDIELAFRKLEIEKIKAEKWNGRDTPDQQVILPNGVSVAPRQ